MTGKTLTFFNGTFAVRDSQTHVEKPVDIVEALRLRAHADRIAERVFDRVLVKRFPTPTQGLPTFLDSHQRSGVLWVLTRSRSYLAHAPGAGKTCEAIVSSLMASGNGQTVFIVPPSLVVNWLREIDKWVSAYAKQIDHFAVWLTSSWVGSTSEKTDVDWGADFIVVPDSMLTKSWVYDRLEKLPMKLLAVDEASRFKEATAERTIALFGGKGRQGRYYSGLVPHARHFVLLDGSPMPNRPMELWAPVAGAAWETIEFLNQHDFGVKYCDGRFVADGFKQSWQYRGASNQEELRKRLQKEFMHVITEAELNHPERLRSIVFMTDSRGKDLRSWEQRHLRELTFDDVDEDMSQGDIAEYRRKLGLTKVEWVLSYVRERLSKNESIIVFAWHRDVCLGIAAGLADFGAVAVLGGTSSETREAAFAAFQSQRTRVLVGNIAAMGRGHNLQIASRVVFAEFSWTDELNKQCEKRASRKGSSHNFVRCDYVVVPSSLDEIVLNSVFTKAKNVKRVIG